MEKDPSQNKTLLSQLIRAFIRKDKERERILAECLSQDDKNLLRGFGRSLITEYDRNVGKYDDPEVQEYFHNLVAAIMLEYRKAYEEYAIELPYRIKAQKSTLFKILKYFTREEKSKTGTAPNGEYKAELKEDLTDMFAMRIVRFDRQSVFYSNYEDIVDLINEKSINYALLSEMQRYRLRIIQSEFPGTKKLEYVYGRDSASRENYYMHLIFILERCKNLIHPNAESLHAVCQNYLDIIKGQVPERFYSICEAMIKDLNNPDNIESIDTANKIFNQRQFIKERLAGELEPEELQYMKASITEEDTEAIDFNEVLNFFSSRVCDKLDLAILTKQVESIFDHSDVLKRFGVSIDHESSKEKRTSDGYVANFAYVNTPFGKVELQLQTRHEYEEGNYGYAAHSNMDGKGFKEFPIPDLADTKKLQDFITMVKFVSPRKFLAEYDHSERGRIRTQFFDTYENYKSIVTQVPEGSEEDKRIKSYFRKLYELRSKIFKTDSSIDRYQGFIEEDIEEFLNSEKYKKLLERYTDRGEQR